MRIYTHTVLISKSFIWMHIFQCQMQNSLLPIHDNNTYSLVNILCTGQLPAHCLGHPAILSFGSKVKAVCAHINHILCADTVSSAEDSHEQFPRSRSTRNGKKGLKLVAAIMTQSFIKSNYEQPLKLWQQRVEAYVPHEEYCTALLAWRL